MQVHAHVCMLVYMHAYACVHMHACTHVDTHVSAHIYAMSTSVCVHRLATSSQCQRSAPACAALSRTSQARAAPSPTLSRCTYDRRRAQNLLGQRCRYWRPRQTAMATFGGIRLSCNECVQDSHVHQPNYGWVSPVRCGSARKRKAQRIPNPKSFAV